MTVNKQSKHTLLCLFTVAKQTMTFFDFLHLLKNQMVTKYGRFEYQSGLAGKEKKGGKY